MPTQKLGIIIKGSEVIFNTPEAITPKSGQTTDDSAADTTNSSTANQECTILWGRKHEQALERFLKSSAETYVITRTAQLAEKMNTAYGRVTMREQSSRWGSCSSAGNLNFNWRLVHATPKIIDYVIIHELAHRTHMDHSKRFWDLVALYDPDYQLHRGWLKRQGHSLS
jgi:predicted metal-dependent hydrolase